MRNPRCCCLSVSSLSLAVAGLALMCVSVTGCAGAGFGAELSKKPRPLLLNEVTGQTVRLPQDGKFAITLAPSEKAKSLEGSADADSNVSPDGSADAHVKVAHGGNAAAGFQLGHSFQNDTQRQIDLDVRVTADYAFEASATPPGPLPDAKVTLHLYALDQRNRKLTEFNFVEHATDKGAASSRDATDTRFTLTLGPGASVSIYLAGQVKVDAKADHSAAGSLKLSNLAMEIASRPAPDVQAASDVGE